MVTTTGPAIFTKGAWVPAPLEYRLRHYTPKSNLGKLVKDMALTYRISPDAADELIRALTSCVIMESSLRITVIRGPESPYGRGIEDYGVVGNKVVTTVGVGYIVDAFQNSVELENMKYHSLGTGSTAEAAGDTALVTELTTEYTGNVRATGTTTEASATVYETVATNTLDGTPGAALREHGVHSASSAGVLLDRTVYAAITLSSGDGLTSTYDLTLTAGS